MDLGISTGTLIVGVFLFIVGVFLKPLVMVLRDMMVWWWIEKYILTKQLRSDLMMYEHEFQLYIHRALISYDFILIDKPGVGKVYALKEDEDVTLTPEEFNRMIENNTKRIKLIDEISIDLEKKSHMLDMLLKHYSQDKPNFVDKSIMEIEKRSSENVLDDIDILKTIVKDSNQNIMFPR